MNTETTYNPAIGDRVTLPHAPAAWPRNRVYSIGALSPSAIRLDHAGNTWSIPLEWAYDWGITRQPGTEPPARHDRIITPDTDPDRFTAEEEAYFRAGLCGMATACGLPWTERCGLPSEPGASFGLCPDHNAELLEEFYPDGTRRP